MGGKGGGVSKLRALVEGCWGVTSVVVIENWWVGSAGATQAAGAVQAHMVGQLAWEVGGASTHKLLLTDHCRHLCNAGRRVALSPSEGAYGRHVKGSASPHDLEATFQLLHLLFTQPPKLEQGELGSVMVQV